VNEAWERVTGWKRDVIVGHPQRDFGMWVDPSWRAEVFAKLRATGVADQIELRLRTAGGEILQMRSSLRTCTVGGKPAVVFTLRDVGEQNRQRDALADREHRLSGLNEATFEGVAVSEGGVILDCNDQLAEIFGYARDEMLGLRVDRIGTAEETAIVRASIHVGRPAVHRLAGRRKDGTTVPIELRARMRVIDGRNVYFSAVRDISERVRAEAELERVVGELRASNAEMEQFVYTVSHDLKSPLVTIQGFLGAIAEDVAAGRLDRAKGDLDRIGGAAEKMTALLDDLLELSRIGRIGAPPEPVALHEVVSAARDAALGRLRGVEVVIGGDLPIVAADRGRLEQVFQNLLENAAKYMGAQARPRIEILTRGDDVIVRDNGQGIEPRHLDDVFGLFRKLDPKSEGTGVGLALVRRIVEFHGGRVWAESEGAGRGTTIAIALPRASRSP
jgi:PAS domain S-box-containing protein